MNELLSSLSYTTGLCWSDEERGNYRSPLHPSHTNSKALCVKCVSLVYGLNASSRLCFVVLLLLIYSHSFCMASYITFTWYYTSLGLCSCHVKNTKINVYAEKYCRGTHHKSCRNSALVNPSNLMTNQPRDAKYTFCVQGQSILCASTWTQVLLVKQLKNYLHGVATHILYFTSISFLSDQLMIHTWIILHLI